MFTGLILVVVLAVGAAIVIYNRLVALKNRVEEAWSDIDTQLKRRFDLIPNLVATVKGYAQHESVTLQKVVEARNAAINAQSVGEKANADTALSAALKSVFAIAESYPELKAQQGFVKLQDELTDTENKLQAARRFYNGNVRDLNTAIETFPYNVMANVFKFGKREFFELENESEKQNVQVKF